MVRGSRGLRVLFAVAFGVATYLFPTSVASAEYLNGKCEAGEFCVFSDANFKGCVFDTNSAGYSDFSNTNFSNCKKSMNDAISSHRNNTGEMRVFTSEPNMKGWRFCVAPNASTADLSRFSHAQHGSPDNQFSALFPGFQDDGSFHCDYRDRE